LGLRTGSLRKSSVYLTLTKTPNRVLKPEWLDQEEMAKRGRIPWEISKRKIEGILRSLKE
jgi:hypothetical protein